MLLLFVLSREFAFQHAPFMFAIYVQRPHEFSLLDYIIIMMQMEICIEFLSKIFPIVAIEINERVLYAYAIKYREINQEKSKSTRFKNSMEIVVKTCSKQKVRHKFLCELKC